MKRALIQTVKVIPGGVGTVIDRAGFLSAIVAGTVTAVTGGAVLGVSITHSDNEGGTFEPVDDPVAVIGGNDVAVAIGDTVDFDVDLLACKQFVKFEATGGAAATFAVALGDPAEMPV